MHETIVENSARNLEIFQRRKRRITRASFNDVHGADLTGAHGVEKTPNGRIETPVETTHQDLAHLKKEQKQHSLYESKTIDGSA